MATKVLTIIPLLVLSGFFFAAGIVEAGVLFLVFAAVVSWAFFRGRAEEVQLTARDEGPDDGPG
jgi:hypothetical protein